MPTLTVHELERFLAAEFPQGVNPRTGFTIEAVWHHGCRVRKKFDANSLRPGGTISGPTMMGLADFAMYVAVLAAIGPVALAVTILTSDAGAPGHILGNRVRNAVEHLKDQKNKTQ